jgi:hypothetical protein
MPHRPLTSRKCFPHPLCLTSPAYAEQLNSLMNYARRVVSLLKLQIMN